jgi:hypothetical protein
MPVPPRTWLISLKLDRGSVTQSGSTVVPRDESLDDAFEANLSIVFDREAIANVECGVDSIPRREATGLVFKVIIVRRRIRMQRRGERSGSAMQNLPCLLIWSAETI